MNRKFLTLTISALAFLILCGGAASAQREGETNGKNKFPGIYRNSAGSQFVVKAFEENKLKISFFPLYAFKKDEVYGGAKLNPEAVSDTATVKGDTAIFLIPNFPESKNCTVTLDFAETETLHVSEAGACDAVRKVDGRIYSIEGVYKKIGDETEIKFPAKSKISTHNVNDLPKSANRTKSSKRARRTNTDRKIYE